MVSILFKGKSKRRGSMTARCSECGRMVWITGYNWTHQIIDIEHDHLQHIIIVKEVSEFS